jgi:uncharacterized ferritin-like protein (DUF455 family)
MSGTGPATVEAWVRDWLHASDLRERLDPPAPPRSWETAPIASDFRPTRPDGLEVVERTKRSVRPSLLKSVEGRCRVLHTFCHHELQAAELFGWAILRFADAEAEFRAGLLGLLLDELRHARLYAAELERNGSRFGAFPVRDWFWQRVPQCRTPLSFVAFVGLGLEAGNLEHAARFASAFREAGDESGARVQEQVAVEEEAHVRFAAHWFRRWSGGLEFDEWSAQLPEPITPLLMRGKPLAHAARLRAGFDRDFLEALESWTCPPSGS